MYCTFYWLASVSFYLRPLAYTFTSHNVISQNRDYLSLFSGFIRLSTVPAGSFSKNIVGRVKYSEWDLLLCNVSTSLPCFYWPATSVLKAGLLALFFYNIPFFAQPWWLANTGAASNDSDITSIENKFNECNFFHNIPYFIQIKSKSFNKHAIHIQGMWYYICWYPD